LKVTTWRQKWRWLPSWSKVKSRYRWSDPSRSHPPPLRSNQGIQVVLHFCRAGTVHGRHGMSVQSKRPGHPCRCSYALDFLLRAIAIRLTVASRLPMTRCGDQAYFAPMYYRSPASHRHCRRIPRPHRRPERCERLKASEPAGRGIDDSRSKPPRIIEAERPCRGIRINILDFLGVDAPIAMVVTVPEPSKAGMASMEMGPRWSIRQN